MEDPTTWNRERLLNAMSIYGAARRDVEAQNVSAESLVAWRLQAATQPRLQAPGVYAARRAAMNPSGAGELFDDLAALGPEGLAAVMYWAQIGGVEKAPSALRQLVLEWRQTIGRRCLPDVLGIRRCYRALAEAVGKAKETGPNRYDGYLLKRA